MSGQNRKPAAIERDPIDDLDPARLMEGVSRSHLGKTLAISLVAHILFVGLLSVGYIGQCIKYKTFAVKQVVKAEQEKARKDEEEKKRQELLKKAQEEAARRETQKKAEEAKPATPPATDAGSTETGEQRVPKVVQEINEVSTERPKPGIISLDKEFDIQELSK
jgi:hypothetical protein